MSINGRTAYSRIRNVHRVCRRLSDGRCIYHHYHRHTRAKLPGQPGSPEFIAAYLSAERDWAARKADCDQDLSLMAAAA